VVVKAAMSEVKTKDHPDGVNFAGGMNPREFYERLNIIGLNYGRLFRNITRLSAARDYKNVDSAKHCWFQVRIPNTRAAMPEEYEQSATIHPATLDAVFQTLFVFGDDPMVPHFIQSIRVAAAMPQGAGHEFLGSAVAVRKGKREAQADISMWEDLEGKQPILDIVGLKVITIATPRTATPDFLPDHRNLCSQVVWGKDVHCVNPSSHTFKTILELMGHNFPGLRALQVGGDADVARFVFTVLGSDTTPRLSSYTIMNETDGIFNKAQTAIANELRPLLGYHQLAHKHNLADSLKQQKYDLILADSRMGIDRGVLTQFLKPTGILARTHHGPDTYCVAAHDPFTGFFLPMTDQPAWMPGPWYSLPQAYPARMSAENVIILVQHIHASPIIKPLVEQLKHMAVGLAVQVMTMTDFWNAILGNETLENIDSYIICLYELTQHPLVYNANRWSYHFVQKLFQKSNQGLLWVTNGAQMETRSPLMAPFLGWARTVRSEEPDKHIICLDVAEEEAHESLGPARTALEICLLFFRSFTSMVPAAVRDVEFTLENGWLHVPRLEPLKEINNLIEKGLDQAQITRKLRGKKPLKLDGGPTGSHEDMHYREDESVERELGPEEVLIEVEECPLLPCDTAVFPSNVREAVYVTDVLGKVLAVGEGVHKFGVLSGEDIVAITLGPVRTHVIVHQSRVWRVYNPEKLKHSLACLITASYCLRDDPSDPIKTVLVYGPAGAQGQAAISLCEHRHIEVFAAVSNQTQRELLTEAGILADDHIVDHDKQLSLNVLQATGGRRVDAIFNAMTDPQKVVTSLSLLRPYGHIIHVVPPHTSPDSYEALPTGGFKLTVFDIGLWLDHYPGVEPVLAEQFDAVNFNSQRQELRSPAGMRVHSFGSITSTVRKMDDDPHYGVHILSGIPSETLPIGRLPRETFPEARLSGSGMYLVAGGLGGLGLDVVMWLADHGARYLTILSRTDVSSHGRLAGACLEALRNQGVEVSVQRVDICDEGLCRSVIRDINSRRPIKGVIHAAAVIKVSYIAHTWIGEHVTDSLFLCRTESTRTSPTRTGQP
jgi:NADPH:quinone reductase-like Zn-dependent oxidoreductase